MKNLLITGPNGLLGRQVCIDCVVNGYNVTALPSSNPLDALPYVNYIPFDFNNPWREQNLPVSVDAIVHLAQSPNFRRFPEAALDVFRVNIESTARLLDYAKRKGVKHFVLASSGGVYEFGSQTRKESDPIRSPAELDYYLASKLSSEMLVNNYRAFFHTTILRFFFVYGSRQNREMFIPRLLDNISQGRKVSLQGDDGFRFNPIHVADASRAVVASVEKTATGTINVAGADVLSIREICEAMGSLLGVSPEYEHQAGEAKSLIGDIEQMKRKLHTPTIRLIDSLDELIAPQK